MTDTKLVPREPTSCWRCNYEYTINDPRCPKCAAWNANRNPDAAIEQLNAAPSPAAEPRPPSIMLESWERRMAEELPAAGPTTHITWDEQGRRMVNGKLAPEHAAEPPRELTQDEDAMLNRALFRSAKRVDQRSAADAATREGAEPEHDRNIADERSKFPVGSSAAAAPNTEPPQDVAGLLGIIAKAERTANWPTDREGMRLVGWILPADAFSHMAAGAEFPKQAAAALESLARRLEEREDAMHARIRRDYDKTVADAWRTELERAERDLAAANKAADMIAEERDAFQRALAAARERIAALEQTVPRPCAPEYPDNSEPLI